MSEMQTGGQRKLVVIDMEYNFSRAIEEGLLRRGTDDTEIHLITEEAYAERFFFTAPTIDVLVIKQKDYEKIPDEYEIGEILLMGETGDGDNSLPSYVRVIPADLAPDELLAAIDSALLPEEDLSATWPIELRETKVITVTSPVGGCGKSLTAYAIARKLRKLDQTVLLVGCDEMQSFSVFLSNDGYADKTLAGALKNPGDETHWSILQSVERDEIDYLRPFERDLPAMGISGEQWGVLIDVLKEKHDFDYLVLDLGSTVTAGAKELLDRTDVMVLVTEENEIASRKLARLQKNPDHLPKCECVLIANEYRADGLRLAPETIFGTIAPYTHWKEALEDPLFYRIALKVAE